MRRLKSTGDLCQLRKIIQTATSNPAGVLRCKMPVEVVQDARAPALVRTPILLATVPQKAFDQQVAAPLKLGWVLAPSMHRVTKIMRTKGNSGLPGALVSLANHADLVVRTVPAPFALPDKPAGTLLIVDEDPAVRELEAELLCREGYNVVQAGCAEEALKRVREAEVIHLLIIDFSMPEIGGLELSHRFRSFYPKTPVLVLSGSLRLLRDGTRELEHVVLLAKPFALSELLNKVRTLLTATPLFRIRKPRGHD